MKRDIIIVALFWAVLTVIGEFVAATVRLYPAPAADKTLAGEPVPSDAELLKDVGKGAKPGIWVAALVIVVILLLFIFGLN